MTPSDSSRSESRRRVEAVRQRGPLDAESAKSERDRLHEAAMKRWLDEKHPPPDDGTCCDVDEVAAMREATGLSSDRDSGDKAGFQIQPPRFDSERSCHLDSTDLQGRRPDQHEFSERVAVWVFLAFGLLVVAGAAWLGVKHLWGGAS